MVAEIRKHARAIKRVKDPVAREIEMRYRAGEIAQSVTPEYAERLMSHPDLVELLEVVWLYSTALQRKRNPVKLEGTCPS